MNKSILLSILLHFTYALSGQTGTIGDPFPSLGYALTVSSAGVYFFDIGGTTFSTHVDANGYVLVAIDFGNGTGNLPQGNSLNLSARGILNPTVLSSITTQTEIRISASSGNIDATTSNATLLGRITTNGTLHTGTADNTINNSWSGTGATNLTNNATGTSPTANTLHRKIFHPAGNASTFHWQPRNNQQRELFSSGEIAATASLLLWVKDNSSPLPIELLDFNAIQVNNQVHLTWETASETNNDFFAIERSEDGTDWEEIIQVDGAGNSVSLLSYSAIDSRPSLGISYYRLKQTDFDGQFEYSDIRSVNLERIGNSQIEMYPNPTKSQITIYANPTELADITIYNTLGQDVTFLAREIEKYGSKLVLDFSGLNSGVYYIKTKTTANKVYKQ